MTSDKKKAMWKYLITIVVSIVFTVTYILQREFPAEELAETMHILCDAFTIPGILLVLSGALVFVINGGGLDSLGYLSTFIVRAFVPTKALTPLESYYDYIQRMRKRPTRKFGHLIIVGAVDLALSFLFLILYFTV